MTALETVVYDSQGVALKGYQTYSSEHACNPENLTEFMADHSKTENPQKSSVT